MDDNTKRDALFCGIPFSFQVKKACWENALPNRLTVL